MASNRTGPDMYIQDASCHKNGGVPSDLVVQTTANASGLLDVVRYSSEESKETGVLRCGRVHHACSPSCVMSLAFVNAFRNGICVEDVFHNHETGQYFPPEVRSHCFQHRPY